MTIVAILNQPRSPRQRFNQMMRRNSVLSTFLTVVAIFWAIIAVAVILVLFGWIPVVLLGALFVARLVINSQLEVARLTCLGSRPEIFIATCDRLSMMYPSSFWREAKHAIHHANAGRRAEADAIADAWTRRKTPIHPEYVQFLIARMDDELQGTVRVMESLSCKDPSWCTHAGMWVDLALNYAELGDWESAVTMLAHTTRYFDESQLRLSGLLAFFGLCGAEDEFESILSGVKEDEFPRFKQDYYRGCCRLAQGDWDGAERYLLNARENLPDNRNRLTLEGMVAQILRNRVERKIKLLQEQPQPLSDREQIRERLVAVATRWSPMAARGLTVTLNRGLNARKSVS